MRPAWTPLRSNFVTGRSSQRGTTPPVSDGFGVEHRLHLLGVVDPVGGEPPPGTGCQACGREGREPGVDQTPLVVTGLRPGVGEERPELGQTVRRDVRLDHPDRVDRAEAHVAGPGRRHLGQGRGDARPPDLQGQHVVRRARGRQHPRRLPHARPDLDDQRRLPAEPVGQPEAGTVHCLVRDHPGFVVGVPGLLLVRGEAVATPGVAQHLADPAAVLGEAMVRTCGWGRSVRGHGHILARAAARSPG